uniref:HECT domain-containing protein n=1 Tax=Amphiprion percula TaxID=161767 RepID=A0A3P8S6T4_AMPPE
MKKAEFGSYVAMFRDGLTAVGVLEAVQRYPVQMKCLFVNGEKALTATDMESLFQIIHSKRGSNAFQEECRTLTFWQDYLQDTECVSLEDILVFFTGCDNIPALGFSPKPSLEFINHSRFPVANTCDNILRIPLHASYTAFKHDMDFGDWRLPTSCIIIYPTKYNISPNGYIHMRNITPG